MCVIWLIHTSDKTHSPQMMRDMTHFGDYAHSIPPFIRVTRLIYVRDMTHSYVWRAPFMCATWLIHIFNMTYSPKMMRDMTHLSDYAHSIPPFICVTWVTHVCDMSDLYVQHDSSTCATWLIHMCNMTHSPQMICDMTHLMVWHDSLTRLTWRIHMCDMTHSYLRHAYLCDMSHPTCETS